MYILVESDKKGKQKDLFMLSFHLLISLFPKYIQLFHNNAKLKFDFGQKSAKNSIFLVTQKRNF